MIFVRVIVHSNMSVLLLLSLLLLLMLLLLLLLFLLLLLLLQTLLNGCSLLEMEQIFACHSGAAVRYADGDEEIWPLDSSKVADAARAAAARVRDLEARDCQIDQKLRLQKPSYLFSGLRAMPFWPREEFAELVEVLESRAARMSAEVLELLRRAEAVDDSSDDDDGDEDDAVREEIKPSELKRPRREVQTEESPKSSMNETATSWEAQGEGLHGGIWLKLELWARGGPIEKNMLAAPEAADAIAAASKTGVVMKEAPGRAALSMVMCGVHVKPHCGPTNHRLRLHLPLLLPGGAKSFTGLSVAGESRTWELHKCLIFDDSFEHEVTLDTAGTVTEPDAADLPFSGQARVVLLLDLWHPDAVSVGLRSNSSPL
eukprot:TRINITY_DN9197_c0_g1_i1.p1 TRINITY_DN9197_c0_g1~~TRINITY_DN9197_c0_g1_i1.p1  ORF type:complete len:373 (+),score=89.83 TRINITY_DN9197_c0_g1_i1:210-1328(+)